MFDESNSGLNNKNTVSVFKDDSVNQRETTVSMPKLTFFFSHWPCLIILFAH